MKKNQLQLFNRSKFLLLLTLFLLTVSVRVTVFAQNLVVNPSFEITNTNCSNFGGEGFRQDLDPSWDNANSNIPGDSCSSPDLFSACNIAATNMPNATSFGIGWQYSRTGTRHVGLIAYSAPFGIEDHYREYIQGHTTSPLVAGQTYCVSFYVSLADGSPYAVEDLGVYFSNTHYLRDACSQGSQLNVTPQLENTCGVLSDTMNWVRLQWDYVAAGGEQYFIIGNFHDDATTNHASANGNGFGNYFAYYFIDDVSIEQNQCCYVEIQGPQSLCPSDGPTNYTASPGISNCSTTISGTWSGTGINASTGVFDPSVAGFGVHTITFNATCGTSTSYDITVAPCMDVCMESNGDLTVNGGTGPFTWSEWSAGGSTPITNQTECQNCGYTWFGGTCLNGFTPATSCSVPAGYQVFATGTTVTPTTNYPLQVEDAVGTIITIPDLNNIPSCSACPTITITMSGVNDISCNGLTDGSATASASGGTPGYTYTWTPGNLNGASQSNLAPGTYTISVSDANLCPGSTTVTINEPTVITLNTNSTPASCGQANGSVSVSASGGTGSLSYLWNPGGATSSSVSSLAAGTYTVVVTDANGCTANGSATISNTNGPALTLQSSSDITCNGANDGAATVSTTGGTPAYSYNWMPGSLSGAVQSSLSAGTYTVTVTDASGCTDVLNITINEPAALQLSSSNIVAATCGSNDGQATVTATGGTAPYSYNWSPTGGTAATANNIPGGSYTVTVTDANTCSEVINIVVPTNGGPTLSISNTTDASCFGAADGTATVSATGGTSPYTYAWSPTGGTAATAANLTAGTYTIAVTDAIGCVSVETVTIGEPSQIVLTESITDEDCGQSNGAVSVSATGGAGNYTYLWSPGGETTTGLSNVTAGNYTIAVTDQDGCSTSSTYTVNVTGGIPVVVSPGSATITSGEQVILTASGANTYTWTPSSGLSCSDCASPIASPEVTTTYIVTGTDLSGCTGADTVTIYVEINCADLFVPTMFSPNGSGPSANEYLCVYGNCISELNFKVFDRWGELVFQTDEAYLSNSADKSTICWDGTFRGKPVQEGSYVYSIYARLFDDTIIEKSGNITIVR